MKKEGIEKMSKKKPETVIAVHKIENKFIVFTNKGIYEEILDIGEFKRVKSNYGKWDEIE